MTDEELIKLWKEDIASQDVKVNSTIDLRNFDFKIACIPINVTRHMMHAPWTVETEW